MTYQPWITLGSVLPAVLGSAVALQVMSREAVSLRRVAMASLALAVAIGTMHYVGMEAMVVDAVMHYRPVLFGLSIVVAYLLAFAALAAFVRLAAPTSLEGMADVTRRQLESHLARVLTDRELRVAALKADGLSLAEIAERLGYANAATVKTTLARIRVKLAALTAELVEFRGHPRPY